MTSDHPESAAPASPVEKQPPMSPSQLGQPLSWTHKAARAFSSPTIYPPTLPFECGGAREFSSLILYALMAGVPYLLKRMLGFSLGTYFVVAGTLALPIGGLALVAHSWIVSAPTEQICALPNEPIET
ncbi:hypothetical protein EV175_007605, partial [Coemansia sp. RSA 1933]